MIEFKYRCKGNMDTDWNERTIEADDQADAIRKLDEIYGVQRDENGNATNTGAIQVELVN